jgi:hypothetical protein
VDVEHLIEEVEGLTGNDRRAVRSELLRMLMHLIKQRIQPIGKARAGDRRSSTLPYAESERVYLTGGVSL